MVLMILQLEFLSNGWGSWFTSICEQCMKQTCSVFKPAQRRSAQKRGKRTLLDHVRTESTFASSDSSRLRPRIAEMALSWFIWKHREKIHEIIDDFTQMGQTGATFLVHLVAPNCDIPMFLSDLYGSFTCSMKPHETTNLVASEPEATILILDKWW